MGKTKSDRKQAETVEGGRIKDDNYLPEMLTMHISPNRRYSTHIIFFLFPVNSSHTCVKSKAFPRSVSSGSPSPLTGWSFWDGGDHQWFNGSAGIICSQLHKRTVNDKYNSIYSDGGLSDVSSHHNLKEMHRNTLNPIFCKCPFY